MKASPFSLKGKKVLVTGGASGIGLGICKGFARLGCSVIVSDISRTAGEHAAKHLRQKFKVKSAYIHCDLTIQEPFMLLHGLGSKPAQRKRRRG